MKPIKTILASLLKFLYFQIINRTRLRELVKHITIHLREGDCVLDVGCGTGVLGLAIMESPYCPPRVKVTGLELIKHAIEHVTIKFYDGYKIPYQNNSFDIIILSDVLHHEPDPHNLIAECVRISRRLIIIKDHKVEGILAKLRISLFDWARNLPYGIPCLYRYNTAKEWKDWFRHHNLLIEHEVRSLKLYPPILNFLFGMRLHIFVVLRVNGIGLSSI
ncbi:MAG: class I SAM-dependent methyltransferase [Candidatus Marinimicrobia bacterium]|nr:class I SAM-dependent methyltransferase [Candidatus Neomarinimicrobiota bacterium]